MMSELLDQALKDQSKDTLKQSLDARKKQYMQTRNVAQAHLLVLESSAQMDTQDAKDCLALIHDCNVKITSVDKILKELE